jgi:dTDP-4-dehydrorhamnose 3,5-epimerase
MRFIPTEIPDVIISKPQVIKDERGIFMETFQEKIFFESGITYPFVQENQSGSRKGVLRGLHYQIRHTQGKLVRVIAGEIFDVVVDLRRSKETFGHWAGMRISAENKLQLWIPLGFAHGIYVLSKWADVIYKTTDYYAPEWERVLLWNDPAIGIKWPLSIGRVPTISEKDSRGKLLSEAELFD